MYHVRQSTTYTKYTAAADRQMRKHAVRDGGGRKGGEGKVHPPRRRSGCVFPAESDKNVLTGVRRTPLQETQKSTRTYSSNHGNLVPEEAHPTVRHHDEQPTPSDSRQLPEQKTHSPPSGKKGNAQKKRNNIS